MPYQYESMIDWVKSNTDANMTWFDVDMALTGEKASWFSKFSKEDIEEVANAVKKTNRFHFMNKIMTSGDDHTQSSLPLHLLILLLLKPKLHAASPDETVKVIDVGSGTGFLATSLALLADKDAKIYGLDCANEASDAQSFIKDSNAIAADVQLDKHPTILAADLLGPENELSKALGSDGKLADAINIGIAVPGFASIELSRANKFLKIGGYVTAPIEDETCNPAATSGRCHAKFTLMKKVEKGVLEVVFAGPEVNFVPGEKCGDSM